jgi:RNA polymerase sigma-70 factor (ECF subfamily)
VKTVEYEKHAVPQEDYNMRRGRKIKLMYKAVYQLNDMKSIDFMYLEDKRYTEISELCRITEVNALKMNKIKVN